MLSYQSFGSAYHPPLLFLHGFLGCSKDWLPMVKHLENDFYCVCISLPGHGSPIQTDMLESFIELQNSLSIKKPTLVGYSMGGRLAMMLREKYPEKYPAAIIISAHVGLHEAEKEKRKSFETTWEHSLENDPFEDFLEKWYNQPLFAPLKEKKELFEEVLQRRKKQDPITLLEIFRKMRLSNQTRYSLLKDTLFLFGENDTKYQSHYLELPQEAKVEMIPNSGHCVHIENPDKCVEKIKNYLNIKVIHPFQANSNLKSSEL